MSNCQSTEFIELETKIQMYISTTVIDITTLIACASELNNITSSLYAILPQDVVTASNILTMIIE